MKGFKDSNWLISGIVTALFFLLLFFIFRETIPFWIIILAAIGVFAGMLFVLKPSSVTVCGIDITKVSNKNKAEATIKSWAGIVEKLKTFKTENAWLSIKTAQLADDANSVFYKINTDTDCLYTAEKFLERYLYAGLLLAEKYERADKAEETVSKGNYGEVKEKIRENFDNMLDYFHENFNRLIDNDVKLITEFQELIAKVTEIVREL